MKDETTNFVDSAEAAEHIGMSLSRFNRLIDSGCGPIMYKPTAKTRLFKRADLDAWRGSWEVVVPAKQSTVQAGKPSGDWWEDMGDAEQAAANLRACQK